MHAHKLLSNIGCEIQLVEDQKGSGKGSYRGIPIKLMGIATSQEKKCAFSTPLNLE